MNVVDPSFEMFHKGNTDDAHVSDEKDKVDAVLRPLQCCDHFTVVFLPLLELAIGSARIDESILNAVRLSSLQDIGVRFVADHKLYFCSAPD